MSRAAPHRIEGLLADQALCIGDTARPALGVNRVCTYPVPAAWPVEFGTDGAHMELAFWIEAAHALHLRSG